MIRTDEKSNIVSDIKGKTFEFEANSSSFNFMIKDLYKYPIRGIIRELASNAMDASKEKGIDVMSWSIKLPTEVDPTFYIEDYGTGISPDDMDSVYRVLFRSTRSSSNDSIGMFGLGSKTPFAYTSSYQVESTYNGFKNIYQIFKNESGEPVVSEPVNPKPIPSGQNGLKVSFYVKPEDCRKFMSEFSYVSAAWPSLPDIVNPEIFVNPSLETISNQNMAFKKTIVPFDNSFHDNFKSSLYGYRALLEMGNVLYPISLGDFDDFSKEIYQKWLISNNVYVIHANIGDVDIVPSREELHYSEKTIKFLEHNLYGLFIAKMYESEYVTSKSFVRRTDFCIRNPRVFSTYIPITEEYHIKYLKPDVVKMFNEIKGLHDSDTKTVNQIMSNIPIWTSKLTSYVSSPSNVASLPPVYIEWSADNSGFELDKLSLLRKGGNTGIVIDRSSSLTKLFNSRSRGTSSKKIRSGILALIEKGLLHNYIFSDYDTITRLQEIGVVQDIVTDFEKITGETPKQSTTEVFDTEVYDVNHMERVYKSSMDEILDTMDCYEKNFLFFRNRNYIVLENFNRVYSEGKKFSSSSSPDLMEFYDISRNSKEIFAGHKYRFIFCKIKDMNEYNMEELGFDNYFEFQLESLLDRLNKKKYPNVNYTKFFSSMSDDMKSVVDSYEWKKDSFFYKNFVETKDLSSDMYTSPKLPEYVIKYCSKSNLGKQLLDKKSQVDKILSKNDFDTKLMDNFPMLKGLYGLCFDENLCWRSSTSKEVFNARGLSFKDVIDYIAFTDGATCK